MKTVTFTVKVITPLFMGGANQQAEIRAQSIKGMIRYWWRICGGSKEEEKKILGWGGDNAIGSKVKIIVENDNNAGTQFEKQFDQNKRAKQTGYNYIAFSLDPRFNVNDEKPRRECYKFGKVFSIKIVFNHFSTEEEIKKVLSAFWCLFNLGNLGSRSRRGFGSLKVLECEDIAEEEFKKLVYFIKWKIDKPVAEWYKEQINIIKGTFSDTPIQDKDIASIGRGFQIYKLSKGNISNNINQWITEVQKGRKGRFLANTFTSERNHSPDGILDILGFLLMAYRSYLQPDYTIAKDIITGNQPRAYNIKRVAFGLPLNFYFSSRKRGGFIEAIDNNNNKFRRASPILFKVVEVSDNNYEGFIIYQKSKFLPDNVTIKLKNTTLSTPDYSIIDDFINSLKEKNIIEEVYRA